MTNWYAWAPLGGQLAGGRGIVTSNADGRLELFGEATGPTGPEIGHTWQLSPNGSWSDWANLGAPASMQFLGGSAVAGNADGRLEAFGRVGLMSSGAVWHIWQTTAGGAWSAWDNLDGDIGPHSLTVGQNQDGRLEVFAVNTQGALHHIWQVSPGAGWSSWSSLGSPAGLEVSQQLAVGRNQDGRLELFAGAIDGALWHIWQTAPNGGWSTWDRLGAPGGGALAELAVGINQDGRMEVFATGQNTLWHIWQTTPNGGWGTWSGLGAPSGVSGIASPAVATNADGRLEVFVFAPGDGVWHMWQTTANAGWSSWSSLGGEPGGGPAVGHNADGRLELFAEDRASGSVHAAWHRWQMVAGGAWSVVDAGWVSGGPTDSVVALARRPGVDLLAAGVSGVWRSQDDAASWTKISPTLLGSSMSVAASGTSIWAVSHDGKQILQSTDSGATWSVRYSTSGQGQINSVLADPNAASTIWAGVTAADGLADVLRSTDGGATWVPVLPFPLRGAGGIGPTRAGPLAAATSLSNFVVAGAQYYHGGGVLKTSDAGATWSLGYPGTYTPLAGASTVAVGGTALATARIYAGLNVMQAGSMVRSSDAGATWMDLSATLPIRGSSTGGIVGNIVVARAHPDMLFISMSDVSTPAQVGVFRSGDGGLTWSEVGHIPAHVAGPCALIYDDKTETLYAATDAGVYRYFLGA